MGQLVAALRVFLKPMTAPERYKVAGAVEELCRHLEAEDIMEAEVNVPGRPKPKLQIGDYARPEAGTTICKVVGYKWHPGNNQPMSEGAWGYRLLSDQCGYMLGHYFDGAYPFYGAQQLKRCKPPA